MDQEEKEKIVVCAVNSDISLEGIEVSIVEFIYLDKQSDQWSMNEIDNRQFEYPEQLRNKIVQTIKIYSKKTKDKFDDKLYNELEKDYGEYVLSQLKQMEEQIQSNQVTLIAFNSLLIHLIENEATKQKSAVFLSKFCQLIANQFNLRVICNYLAYDFYLEGKGGPFQIIGQAKLFDQQDTQLNLSGFASITQYQDKDAKETYSGNFICPAMFALNYAAGWKQDIMTQGLQSKAIDAEFLKQLSNPDKFNYTVFSFGKLMDLIDQSKLQEVIKVATLKQYICQEIQSQLGNIKLRDKVYVSGNFSEELFEFLRSEMKQYQFQKCENHKFIDSIIAGFLAVRKNKQLLNIFQGVTKAKSDHCSGIIYIKTEKPITISREPEIKKPKEKPKQHLDNSEDFDLAIQNQDEVQIVKSQAIKQLNKK